MIREASKDWQPKSWVILLALEYINTLWLSNYFIVQNAMLFSTQKSIQQKKGNRKQESEGKRELEKPSLHITVTCLGASFYKMQVHVVPGDSD